ncbi:rod shape-determining protein MreC [Psychroflexus sp. YR1-1]|uniref:Cell shape-determining protein MreC n=1 Tax=Psychroflexus aurantiacus TaxID=2709310 RepID=A0A6B3R343_9FLAO|nr:rod shape-determining protein MreC [Psychroflexus aurantiacus]NEV94458.1 rod shape-determining protein MreC [Psychroflexus aurantiacus]
MQQIILFLIKNKTGLVFIILMTIALGLTFQAHTYHNSKLVSSANFITGKVLGTTESVDQYFDLKTQNEILLEENETLRRRLLNTTSAEDTLQPDLDYITDTLYRIQKARVISNYYDKIDNYLLIEGGTKDSIKADLGVISSKGIIGIVIDASKEFSRVISILNTNTSINAKLKNTSHFGTLTWNGKDPNLMNLVDVPRSAPVKLGDTITTGGRSLIFPEDVPIGVISDYQLNENLGYYTISVRLFNDMTNLKHIYVIENVRREEAYEVLNEEKP